jgi:hypothetical protein
VELVRNVGTKSLKCLNVKFTRKEGEDMKNNRYKSFRNYIVTASKQDQIWWDGFYFLDLTERQFNEIRDICISKGFEIKEDTVLLPSGIGLKKV